MGIKISNSQNYWLERPAIILFFFTLLILFIRVCLRNQVLLLDEAEQVIMAQQLLPGYIAQPPLYTWLQYGVFKLFGVHLYSLALLKYSLLFGCFYFFHLICRLHCRSTLLAWCATVSWALIPAISFDLIKDNTHSILALFAACLTWYWFISPSRLSKTIWYLIFGSILGIGFLSKFNYLLFLIIMLGSAMSIAEYRSKLINSGMLFTLLIALAIASPYILWLLTHADAGLDSTYKLVPAKIQRWRGIVQIIKTSLVFASPVFLIATIFFPIKQWTKGKGASNHLLIRYHAMSLPILAAVVLITGFSAFQTRWLIPILFLCPVLYFNQVQEKSESAIRIRRFLITCLVTQLVLLSALIFSSHSKYNKRKHMPLTQVIQSLKSVSSPAEYIVSDSYWLLGNLMIELSLKKVWLVHHSNQFTLPKGNSILVWQEVEVPYWVNYLAQSHTLTGLKSIEDPNHTIVAGQAYIISQ